MAEHLLNHGQQSSFSPRLHPSPFFSSRRVQKSRIKTTSVALCTHTGAWVHNAAGLTKCHFCLFLHHSIENIKRHLLCKFHKKIQRKTWSNVPPKLLACIRFLYKVVHKNGRLRKFNRAREIQFNSFIAWTLFMKLGKLGHHVHGYKALPQNFYFWPRDLITVFQSRTHGVISSLNVERS